jgi:hypothetical protein
MTKELHGLCQSGQAVKVPGVYELVGVRNAARAHDNEATHATFNTGDLFPNYEGRAVCWYLVAALADETTPPTPVSVSRRNTTGIN